MNETPYFPDCRWFRGDVPCVPHKRNGYHCGACPHYERVDCDILVIKLGAVGDVIRTTPLLRKLKALHPHARVWWLTHTPEILPSAVDVRMKFDLAGVTTLSAMDFDVLVNLDKDREACALAGRLKAGVKRGFILRDGVPAPVDEFARHKFLTGIFDDLNRLNTKHYIQEIFEICGFQWEGEEYILEVDSQVAFDLDGGAPVVGLNTGCGGRWTSRLWPDAYWVELARQLRAAGYTPLFLGGAQEHEKNVRLAAEAGGTYLGHFPLNDFIALVDRCEVVVTAVTMALHIAIGLRKRVVLFNNIFNPAEFELFGRGEILSPSRECRCFFSPTCVNPEYRCMEHLEPARVFEAVLRWVTRPAP
ncbi:MAG: glycosyltransferase family 9 protein [Bacteroidota bacterium]|nr:glycosyltransferase family 9 protein [Bacteroidota bacterium]